MLFGYKKLTPKQMAEELVYKILSRKDIREDIGLYSLAFDENKRAAVLYYFDKITERYKSK